MAGLHALLLIAGLAAAVPVSVTASTAVVWSSPPVGQPALEAGGQPGASQRPLRQWMLPDRRGPSQEPATARGYADGYRRGLSDGRDRNRYDPVGHSSYKDGDAGYSRQYGPREAYRNNYRAGFRQGYEDGYRDGARGRR